MASTIAPAEYPDCIAPASTKASWIGWNSPVATLSASTVVISWPAAWAASSTSAETSRPSKRTAAAPVSPVAEPNRTLKNPSPRSTGKKRRVGPAGDGVGRAVDRETDHRRELSRPPRARFPLRRSGGECLVARGAVSRLLHRREGPRAQHGGEGAPGTRSNPGSRRAGASRSDRPRLDEHRRRRDPGEREPPHPVEAAGDGGDDRRGRRACAPCGRDCSRTAGVERDGGDDLAARQRKPGKERFERDLRRALFAGELHVCPVGEERRQKLAVARPPWRRTRRWSPAPAACSVPLGAPPRARPGGPRRSRRAACSLVMAPIARVPSTTSRRSCRGRAPAGRPPRRTPTPARALNLVPPPITAAEGLSSSESASLNDCGRQYRAVLSISSQYLPGGSRTSLTSPRRTGPLRARAVERAR